MNYDDQANGGPNRGDGGSEEAPQALDPPPSGPFSRPVAVANVAILFRSTKGQEKSQLSHQRVTMSALGNDRVNRVLPSDLWLIPWSGRQNSRAEGIRHGC